MKNQIRGYEHEKSISSGLLPLLWVCLLLRLLLKPLLHRLLLQLQQRLLLRQKPYTTRNTIKPLNLLQSKKPRLLKNTTKKPLNKMPLNRL